MVYYYNRRAVRSLIFLFSKQRRRFTIASFFYWNITSYSSRSPKISAVTTTRPSLFLSWLTCEIISNPVASELFISVFSPSAFSAPSAVKSFRCNRKRYYRSNYTGKSSEKQPKSCQKACLKIRSKQVKHRGTRIIMNPPVFIVLSTA